MNNSRGASVFEVLGCLVVVFIVAAILFPMFAKTYHSTPASTCQSNMKLMGTALKTYLSNWDDKFPINCIRNKDGQNGPVRARVKLSQFDKAGKKGSQIIYQYGVNWVEALYKYNECLIKQNDDFSVWKCPAVANDTYPERSHTAFVSYVFNRNLAGKSEGIVLAAYNLMMVREMDMQLDAELRPINDSTGNPNRPPISPFLTARDCEVGETNAKLHMIGSNILFIDGHVKMFSTEYFPEKLTKDKNWDPETKQWYNFVFKKPAREQIPLNKSIAITP